MDAITSLAQDERVARVMLAMGSEPGDRITGRLLMSIGASLAVEAAATGVALPGLDRAEREVWQQRVMSRLSVDYVREVIADAHRGGMDVLIPGDKSWPAALTDLGERAPFVLWARGDLSLLNATAGDRVTLTGARASTGYGEHVATELAAEMVARGRQVVAGGAYGIDSAIHRAALTSRGPTIAVLPSGLDRLYPSGNEGLLERIGQSGLLLSELPPRTPPTKWRFQQQARMVAALSGASVIVEAGYRSGSLSVARRAAELGRGAGAVPGPVTSPASAGCHRLIQERVAAIVTNADDLDRLLLGDAPVASRTVSHQFGARARTPAQEGRPPV